MVLSDHDIKLAMKWGQLEIEPLPDQKAIQPASIDLHLGYKFLRPKIRGDELAVEISGPGSYEWSEILHFTDYPFVLKPGCVALGETLERVRLGDLSGQFSGCSTIGRAFLAVHITAGYIDPGFNGKITVEMVNHGPSPLILRPGQRIGQLVLSRLSSPPSRPYDGRYQGAIGVEPPKEEKK